MLLHLPSFALPLAISEHVLKFEHRDLHAWNLLVEQCPVDGVSVYADLSQDTGLFEQNGLSNGGDYQYDVYNMMKAAVSDDNWASFCPRTNILWMGYAAKKLFNNRFIRAKRKEAIEELFQTLNKNFATIHDLLVHPDFLSGFAELTSG
ncbi:hypothetical protein niasHS_007076 [Heterodera schachtii]|uniref:non-specific serine/threonine protein kinase n=1 Tax=Heterodera schachtii TaxID=97005 RepID=A0ABD2JFG1_HETSC